MTEKIVYVAIDGSEFMDEQECIDYENSLNIMNLCKSTLFLDINFNVLKNENLNPEEVFYLFVNNDDDKKIIDDYFSSNWCSSPFSTSYGQYVNLSEYSGWFYFDNNKDEWEHFETKMEIYKEIENNFSKIILDNNIKM